MKTLFTSFYTITQIQQKIMRYVDYWVHTEKTPISQKRILQEMESTNENRKTVIHALDGLLKQGYLRRAITSGEKNHATASYVQLRRV